MNDFLDLVLQTFFQTRLVADERWLVAKDGMYSVYKRAQRYNGGAYLAIKTKEQAVAVAVLISGMPTIAAPRRWLIAVPDEGDAFLFEVWEGEECDGDDDEKLLAVYTDASVALRSLIPSSEHLPAKDLLPG